MARLSRLVCTAPAFRIDWCDDGGTVLVATESYQDWYTSPRRELAEYLSQKVSGMNGTAAWQHCTYGDAVPSRG